MLARSVVASAAAVNPGSRGTAVAEGRRPYHDPDDLVARHPRLADRLGIGPTRDLTQPPRERPSHRIRLLRPRDLVNLEVLAFRCRLDEGAKGPMLVPARDGAWLEVRWPFQHVAERAWYEVPKGTPTPPTGPGTGPTTPPDEADDLPAESPTEPPTDARAAHGSRLVYDLPAGERVVFTTAGILEACSRLALRVPTLATPRPEGRRVPALREVLADLGGGLLLVRADGRLLVRAATEAWQQERAAAGLASTLRTARGRIAMQRLLAAEVVLDPGEVAGTGTLSERIRRDLRTPIPGRRPQRQLASPRADETAIEAPYRLLISPSEQGGFASSAEPVAAPEDASRVELWHARLGVRRELRGGPAEVDERPDPQRIVRAVWTRDLAYYSEAQLTQPENAPFEPFRHSLDRRDRRILVRQSAETALTVPRPVDVERLYLSALGAWLDLHGAWEHHPYSNAGQPAIESWDHVAPMARDQYVRVVYPGYLFPFGHQAALVKVTERKIKPLGNGKDQDPHAPQARLYQRKFIVVGEPVRDYDHRDLPFTQARLRPLATPDLDDPAEASTPFVVQGQDLFWPSVGNRRFRFTLDALDHELRPVRLHLPLLFVASHVGATPAGRNAVVAAYTDDVAKANVVEAAGQATAFAASSVPGDTSVEVRTFTFSGDPEVPGATADATQPAVPRLAQADVVVPAARHLGPARTSGAPDVPAVTVSYPQAYVAGGFADATEVFLTFASPLKIDYGGGTDRAGGFVQPDLAPRQLSRALGAVGALAPAGGGFDPKQLLDGVLPKLFGLFDLWEVLEALGLDELPRFVTESLDQVAALATDLERLADRVDATIDRLQEDAASANAAVKATLDAARQDLQALTGNLTNHVATIVTAFEEVLGPGASKQPDDVLGAIQTALGALKGIVADVRAAITGAPLPPTLRAELDRLVAALEPPLQDVDALLAQVRRFLDAIDPEGLAVRAHYTWQPTMRPWPNAASAVFLPQPDSFTLSVEARASATAGAGLDVLAELRSFALELLPGEPLLRMEFERIAFRVSSGRKPETDVVFGGIQFLGVLGFIDTLRSLIPFDGFADPPYLDVTAEGVTAGFDLALPNVAVGVFSLENLSLGADCRVPFLGDAVTVGFNFCTRDKPFRLTVMAIGGGGFVAIRLSPQGLVVLEMALEAGASLSINLGVASGSVSAMVGVYLRLEADAGSLTGYFRLRGEVNVLGLISASITLELSLTYDFPTGKMVGKASVVVEVSVLFFSASVTISVERRLAGSNGDPTFGQLMGVTSAGTSDAWDTYCRAFAAE
jgi:hypothetical protein